MAINNDAWMNANAQPAMSQATSAANNTALIWYGMGGLGNAQQGNPTPYREPTPAYKNPKLLLTRKA